MRGLSTRNPQDITQSTADLAFYTAKRVSGETVAPRADAINSLACFGDQSVADESPDRLAVDAAGTRATTAHSQLDWPMVCPTDDAYQGRLLELVDQCTSVSPDLRLTTVGFPTDDFCHCERCHRRFAESDTDDRLTWRASVVTEFVTAVAERVPGDLYLTVHPDPYPGTLRARTGLDLTTLDDVVDGFVVPLCDPRYETTYWLETIARGFATRLTSPVLAQLMATPDNRERLPAATTCVEPYADGVVYGGNSDVVRSIIQSSADSNEPNTSETRTASSS